MPNGTVYESLKCFVKKYSFVIAILVAVLFGVLIYLGFFQIAYLTIELISIILLVVSLLKISIGDSRERGVWWSVVLAAALLLITSLSYMSNEKVASDNLEAIKIQAESIKSQAEIDSNQYNLALYVAGITGKFSSKINVGSIYLVKMKSASGESDSFAIIINANYENDGTQRGTVKNIKLKLILPNSEEVEFFPIFEVSTQKVYEGCNSFYKQDYLPFNLGAGESKSIALEFFANPLKKELISGNYSANVFIDNENKFSFNFLIRENELIDWAHGTVFKIDLESQIPTHFGNWSTNEPQSKICSDYPTNT